MLTVDLPDGTRARISTLTSGKPTIAARYTRTVPGENRIVEVIPLQYSSRGFGSAFAFTSHKSTLREKVSLDGMNFAGEAN